MIKKMLRLIFFLIIFSLTNLRSFAFAEKIELSNKSIQAFSEDVFIQNVEISPKKFPKLFSKKNKTVAAVLAFPILACTGLHRVYLGTKAWVPVVYIATLGG